jgi:hypothetical protein
MYFAAYHCVPYKSKNIQMRQVEYFREDVRVLANFAGFSDRVRKRE